MMNPFFSKNHIPIDIPIEVDFIRACTRLEMPPLWQEKVDTYLREELDWKMVLHLANHHRVMPLLYRTLYSTFQSQVPETAMSDLRTVYQSNAARNLFLTNELVKILDLFEAEGISGMAIKGPALAKAIYGDVTLRQFDDLDVLVREGDVATASELLLSLGYIPVVAAVGSEAETFLKSEGECGFSSPCGRYQVDIHWHMVPRSFLVMDHEGVRERSQPISLERREIRSLAQEDLLFLLCIHGMRHLWSRHAWICDFALTIQKDPDLDWEGVFARAQDTKVERIFSLGLFIANNWFELVLPEWVLERMTSDRNVTTLGDRLLSEDGFHLPVKTSLLELYWVNTLVRQGLGEKAGYLLKQIFTPSLEDLSLIRIPNAISLLYAILRPLRLIKEYTFNPISRKVNSLGILHRPSG